MRRANPWMIAAVSVLSLPLIAQEPAQEPRGEVPVVSETINVRVVNVEAVVTDASGKPVRGLSAGDFRLLVDGREVPVEYFTEVAEGTSVATKPAHAPTAPAAPGGARAGPARSCASRSWSKRCRRPGPTRASKPPCNCATRSSI